MKKLKLIIFCWNLSAAALYVIRFQFDEILRLKIQHVSTSKISKRNIYANLFSVWIVWVIEEVIMSMFTTHRVISNRFIAKDSTIQSNSTCSCSLQPPCWCSFDANEDGTEVSICITPISLPHQLQGGCSRPEKRANNNVHF